MKEQKKEKVTDIVIAPEGHDDLKSAPYVGSLTIRLGFKPGIDLSKTTNLFGSKGPVKYIYIIFPYINGDKNLKDFQRFIDSHDGTSLKELVSNFDDAEFTEFLKKLYHGVETLTFLHRGVDAQSLEVADTGDISQFLYPYLAILSRDGYVKENGQGQFPEIKILLKSKKEEKQAQKDKVCFN